MFNWNCFKSNESRSLFNRSYFKVNSDITFEALLLKINGNIIDYDVIFGKNNSHKANLKNINTAFLKSVPSISKL
jgi:hypothetical protein